MSDAEAVAAEISQGPTREVLQLQYQFAHLLRQFDQEQDARDLAAARANLRMRDRRRIAHTIARVRFRT